MRLLLKDEGFDVPISQENFDNFREWPGDSGSSLLIIFDVEGGVPPYAQMGTIQAKYPQARVVILADRFDYSQVMMAFEAGAHGFIIKDIPCRSLMESLRLVAMGEKVMPSALAGFLPGKLSPRSEVSLGEFNCGRALSDREMETFQHMSWGEPNKVIAHKLGISEATVKVHVKAILRKLHLRNRTQAVAWALNVGFDFAVRAGAITSGAASGFGSGAHGQKAA